MWYVGVLGNRCVTQLVNVGKENVVCDLLNASQKRRLFLIAAWHVQFFVYLRLVVSGRRGGCSSNPVKQKYDFFYPGFMHFWSSGV